MAQIAPSSPIHIQYPLWFGGSASCMAVVVSHPLDLLKVRMQMKPSDTKKTGTETGTGTLGSAMRILRTEGIRGLYSGVRCSLLSTELYMLMHDYITYGTIRIATYETLKHHFASPSSTTNTALSPLTLTFLASISGFLGAVPGNASDIANIRMQNDTSLPAHKRYGYRHVLHAWSSMYQSEGFFFWTKGILPNAFRCAMMTGCQLGSYDIFKGLFGGLVSREQRDGVVVHAGASLGAAFVATTVCSPVDVVKTQLMGGGGGGGKRSVLRVVADLTKSDGILWVFRGWLPSFVRLGPQTVATLILLEQHKKVYRGLITGRG
ncbi:mitochondrial carrier domain-containing protein [Aspergillus pseudoustus]|uniref:Mitochondrial carrier domain-containing protein n=1 Tax=Aspergillus pseudoustus TaxID=1810923 RepID=A0ABR4KRB0_9EURO